MRHLIILILSTLFTISLIAQDGADPTDYGNPPCPPNNDTKEYCFTNTSGGSSGEFLCPMEICLILRYTPFYLSQCEAAPLSTDEDIAHSFCITLLPGQNQCIYVPVPSLPLSQWYNVSLKVGGLANPGQEGTVLIPASAENGPFQAVGHGGCGPEPWRYFRVDSFDGTNFNVWFDAI